MSKNMIEAQGLVKQYDGIKAVRDLSFAIRQGEIFGFLGPNGAGKTTTISMLSCLLEPTAGSATVAGYDIVKESSEVKRRIGLVPQELSLYSTLSARDNLNFFGHIYGHDCGDGGVLRDRQNVNNRLAARVPATRW